ncbi:MAG TPA: hypothetical protein VEV45_18625 [Streptosporangiaceae bacterium]|nr:hypothetical protein [Streptosporangiaceae bacterium]
MPERLGAAEAAATARLTDAAASRPWSRLAPGRAAELAELLRPVAGASTAALPFPSGASANADRNSSA